LGNSEAKSDNNSGLSRLKQIRSKNIFNCMYLVTTQSWRYKTVGA